MEADRNPSVIDPPSLRITEEKEVGVGVRFEAEEKEDDREEWMDGSVKSICKGATTSKFACSKNRDALERDPVRASGSV